MMVKIMKHCVGKDMKEEEEEDKEEEQWGEEEEPMAKAANNNRVSSETRPSISQVASWTGRSVG